MYRSVRLVTDTKTIYQPSREFAEILGFFKSLAELGNPRVSGAELFKSRVTRLRQKPRQGGFPTTDNRLGSPPATALRLSHPGGPQNIALSEDARLVSTFRSKESTPVRWLWPTKSSRVCGLSLSARGICDRVSTVVFPRFGLGVFMEAFRLSGAGVGVGGSSTLLGPLVPNIGASCVPLAWVTTKAALHPESRCLFMFFSRTRPPQTGLLRCKKNKDDCQ